MERLGEGYSSQETQETMAAAGRSLYLCHEGSKVLVSCADYACHAAESTDMQVVVEARPRGGAGQAAGAGKPVDTDDKPSCTLMVVEMQRRPP